jgi:D-alanyl-D-alanine carboxypeptidase
MTQSKSDDIIRVILLAGTLVSTFFIPWPLLKVKVKGLPNTIQEQVDKGPDYGFDGTVVYIDQKGKPAKTYTSGYNNRESKVPADPNALFKVASIDKLYTAVSVAKLVHSEDLSLDKTVLDYFPEYEGRLANADRITLRMLMHHRSGLPNFTDVSDFWNDPTASSQETLELVFDLPADFEPDKRYRYCNTNYLLVSLLIEKVTGASKFQFIKAHILDPLSLENTYGSLEQVNLDDVMSGYYGDIEEDLKSINYGGMLATAEDVGVFLRALNDGSVFEDEEEEIYASIYVYNHTGLMPGYQSIARYNEDIDTVIILFTNTSDFKGYNWGMAEVMYKRVLKILRKE